MTKIISFDLGFKTFTYSIIEFHTNHINISETAVVDLTVNIDKK
jgi:hypothetical protein